MIVTENSKTDIKVIFALCLMHFTGDFYNSFVNPLMPLFVEKYSLTLAQVGLLAGLGRFLAFIVQPSTGYIADHYRTRFFILGGPLLTVIFIPLVGVAPSFLFLLLFICLGSIGSAMYHPTAAGMVSTYSGSRFGLSMSVFNLGGTFAFGVGPLFITFIVGKYGLNTSPLTMVIGLILLVVLFKTLPVPAVEGLADLGFIGSIKEAFGPAWKSILLIWVVMVVRSYVGQSFMTFLPVLYAKEGYSLVSIGAIISIFTVSGALPRSSSPTNTQMDIREILSGRFFHPGHSPSWRYHGSGACAPWSVHGVESDDGACLRHRRPDGPSHRHGC